MATLTDRIQAKRNAPPAKLRDRRPVPMWRRRIELNRAKDLTPFFLNGSWVPDGDGGAA